MECYALEIAALSDTILDGRTKGIPGTAAPFPLGDIGAKGWNVLREDMPLPLMVLKEQNRTALTVAHEWPASSSNRMWARRWTSGSADRRRRPAR